MERKQTIFIAVVVPLLSLAAAIVTIPEVRRWCDLDAEKAPRLVLTSTPRPALKLLRWNNPVRFGIPVSFQVKNEGAVSTDDPSVAIFGPANLPHESQRFIEDGETDPGYVNPAMRSEFERIHPGATKRVEIVYWLDSRITEPPSGPVSLKFVVNHENSNDKFTVNFDVPKDLPIEDH